VCLLWPSLPSAPPASPCAAHAVPHCLIPPTPPLQLRFLHNPDSLHAFCGAALSSNLLHMMQGGDGKWVHKVGFSFPCALGTPFPSKAAGAGWVHKVRLTFSLRAGRGTAAQQGREHRVGAQGRFIHPCALGAPLPSKAESTGCGFWHFLYLRALMGRS